MFTEGLDEQAINWVKQGKDVNEPRVRSPLTENLPCDAFPKSPLLKNSTGLLSPSVLPPLKFNSGLLPGSFFSPCIDDDSGDNESVSSVGNYSEHGESYDTDISEYPIARCFNEEELFGSRGGKKMNLSDVAASNAQQGPVLSRGLSKENLRIELPENYRRLTHGGGCITKRAYKNIAAPSSCSQIREKAVSCKSKGTPMHGFVRMEEMGPPSAPPVMDIKKERDWFEDENEHSSHMAESEKSDGGLYTSREPIVFNWNKENHIEDKKQFSENAQFGERTTPVAEAVGNPTEATQIPYWQTGSLVDSSYNTCGQHAWQTLIAYDACIRMCLNAWARGCTEAPEFLRDECLLLRSAFGLHNFLLQPRVVQKTESKTSKSTEQTYALKENKLVGKIRVEVKRIRVIPRRKLKSTYSQRGMIYMQAGADYIRHVSSLVKNGMTTFKMSSISMTCEDPLFCLLQLKSTTEDEQLEQGSAICLQPRSGNFHVFFPENQADALMLEVQDEKRLTHGRATIPVSSLADDLGDKLRWYPIFHDDQECVGKVQLSISSTVMSDETNQIKNGPVVETLAYDLVLAAAMRAQHFHSRNLKLHWPWEWLLSEFADYYGVSDTYTKLRYLSHIMNVATPTKDCLELVSELMIPILNAKSNRSLTRQEKSILLDCETQIEGLLAKVFENYKSLDENSPTGLADLTGPTQDSAAPALFPAVEVYTLLHDILAQESQAMLRNYLENAAKKRCRKHMAETDEFISSGSEGFLVDPTAISTAHSKMKKLCLQIRTEIQADIKIHNQHILPSSIDLSNITAAVYNTELCKRIQSFLVACPPSNPQPHVNELLIATADFERDLESWGISLVQGGVDAKNLFHGYIMVWVEDMELHLLDLCKAEKVPWSGVTTNHSTSPFAEEMYDKMERALMEYKVVINRWPQYSILLEKAVANVERAIIKALEKQYNDILTPLKDNIPNRLNMHVQKLTRRQSTVIYSVPSQLGIFLNTIKRILDVLHCRVEEVLRSWASYLPANEDKKHLFGEQINGITVLLRTKYKNYLQATVGKLMDNMQANRSTRLKRILEETREEDGEAEVRERMQTVSSQLISSLSNLHNIFTSQIFIAACRGWWDRMGQIVLKFLEDRKENRVWYKGSYYALGVLDDTFASEMQRLEGNALQEKDLEPPRSVTEARSILSRDTTKAPNPSSYFYV